jgi:hypothetical protein
MSREMYSLRVDMWQVADRNINYYRTLKVFAPRTTVFKAFAFYTSSQTHPIYCTSVRYTLKESTSDYKSIYRGGHRNHPVQNLSLYPYMH